MGSALSSPLLCMMLTPNAPTEWNPSVTPASHLQIPSEAFEMDKPKAPVHPRRIMDTALLPSQCHCWVRLFEQKTSFLFRKSSAYVAWDELSQQDFVSWMCLFCPTMISTTSLWVSTFFYFLKGNNNLYGALKCRVSTGVMADTTTITRTKVVSIEERHRYVAS